MKMRKVAVVCIMVALVAFVAGNAFGNQHGLFLGYPIVRILVDGEEIQGDTPGVMLKGRTMVPIRFILDVLGAEVAWDEVSYTASITTKQQTAQAPEDEPPAPPSPNNPKIGDTLTYADWEYKVLKVETHSNLSGTFNQNIAKGKYVVALVEFKNKALFERNVGSYWVATDSQGRRFNLSTDGSLGYHQAFKTEAWYLEEIGASFSAVVPLAFDMPLDAKNITLYPAAPYQGAPASGAKGVLLLESIN